MFDFSQRRCQVRLACDWLTRRVAPRVCRLVLHFGLFGLHVFLLVTFTFHYRRKSSWLLHTFSEMHRTTVCFLGTGHDMATVFREKSFIEGLFWIFE
jgi:hypothetical protein